MYIMETLEQFTQEHYKNFMDIYNNCNTKDKFALILLRSIGIVFVFFTIAGCMAPKNYLVLHLLLCFIVFISVEQPELNVINIYIYNILKRNNVNKLDEEKLKKASNLLPINNSTVKKILIIVGLISLLGYINYNYSANEIIKKTHNNLENILTDDCDNYNIITEFKISKKINNNVNNVNNVNNGVGAYKLITNDVSLYDNLNFKDSVTNINLNSPLVDLNENGLSIFNKIKPIDVNIVPVKVPELPRIITSDINVNLSKMDKNKILKSLYEFNKNSLIL